MTTAEFRINRKIEQVKLEYGPEIVGVMNEANRAHLRGRGTVSLYPALDDNSLRWTMEWKDGRLSFDLSLILSVEDDGSQAVVGKAWVHRHAASSLDYEGHTPTTRMRRLTGLSVESIREAIEAELI